MVSKIISGAVVGVDGILVVVEVDISPGLPGTDVVGLPDSAVKESRERVRAAIRNSGFRMPDKRITVNLSPASTKKAGSAFDLPIAVGILAGMEAIPAKMTRGLFIAGELSLDGKIQPVDGVLSMVDCAHRQNIRHCVVPYENGREAALVKGMRVAAIKTLKDLTEFFNTRVLPDYAEDAGFSEELMLDELTGPDFSDVKGQEHVKRALEVAAAGAHNVLMTGPPGSGKTMLARRVPSILTDLSFEESLEVTKVYSVAGLMPRGGALITKRPFRSPHHTLSSPAMTGGGKHPMPGEISLAHNGVLFLDEFPEFHKDAREALRQPMEEGAVTISRASGKVTYPSRFMLICAMNPCPCGYYGEEDRCTCAQADVNNYQEKLSGPLLDRIDIHVNVPRVEYEELRSTRKPENSAEVRARVSRARAIQLERYAGLGATVNARLSEPMTERFCRLDADCSEMLKRAYDVIGMSARAYHKVLKVARTIADLDGAEDINERHLAEALQYRGLDRKI